MMLPPSIRRHLVLALGLLLLPVLFSGCDVMDPEYFHALASVRTNCQRNDIVGLWVSQITGTGATARLTLLISRDGTGRLRMKVVEGTAGNGQNLWETSLRWTYGGHGLWQGDILVANRPFPEKATFQYTGRQLLFKEWGTPATCYVCVRADDPQAVEAHLQERRNIHPLFQTQPNSQPQSTQ